MKRLQSGSSTPVTTLLSEFERQTPGVKTDAGCAATEPGRRPYEERMRERSREEVLAWSADAPPRKLVVEAVDETQLQRVPTCAEEDPRGPAAIWLDEVYQSIKSLRGRAVATQLARLCGDVSCVVVSQRVLADAVGRCDRLGRPRAYAEGGVDDLIAAGLLRKEVSGRGRGARTTYQLLHRDWMVEDRPPPPWATAE